ncbi:MAG: 3-hydroxyacyl-ACP dehydratase FabZ [Propionivibrio sp.]|jgi:3-hydroxyacyl-[acyl-carrier-protein] dehydratase|uniref:3-hydroxyacyl-[acyl-carrier-protein] dehydratase FabZ n=1 Tax=Candidatus Propionivibrio dominans TaxID=2954373 RepID=A0A9D7I827_9RHOO|nr:3-hydroxyacyl-ACP dehydratase FabZ [Candidatus Propionivibrio dominans]MBL0165802.1 3-hydroxyacyl-ACP dehydratase FabZ [Propionivibrio sp.]
MDINEVIEHLPHRYPFLLVDRVIDCEPGKSIHAYKNISINEPFFVGHFPNFPVMPGVLITEALAQAAGILSFKTLGVKPDNSFLFYLVGVDRARFKKPVTAGDQLHLHVQIQRQMRNIWTYKAEAKVDGEIVAEAGLMCAKRELT